MVAPVKMQEKQMCNIGVACICFGIILLIFRTEFIELKIAVRISALGILIIAIYVGGLIWKRCYTNELHDDIYQPNAADGRGDIQLEQLDSSTAASGESESPNTEAARNCPSCGACKGNYPSVAASKGNCSASEGGDSAVSSSKRDELASNSSKVGELPVGSSTGRELFVSPSKGDYSAVDSSKVDELPVSSFKKGDSAVGASKVFEHTTNSNSKASNN